MPTDSFAIKEFGGMLPAWDTTLLPDGQAASSENAYLFSGALTGWRAPKLLRELTSSTAKMVYRVPTTQQAVASATLVFSGNPSDGDTVFIGEETYTFRTTIKDPYDVLIGTDAETSANNLLKTLTLDDGKNTNVGVIYVNGTVANPFVDQSSPTSKNMVDTDDGVKLLVYAPAFGAAYNSTNIRSSGVNISWGATKFAGGQNQTFDSAITGDSAWMEFDDPYTDVMRSPVVDDQFDRYYFASPSLPPQYNTRDRILNGDSPWLLGVPAPGCAPGVEVEGGGNTDTIGVTLTNTQASLPTDGNYIYLYPVTPVGAVQINDVSIMPAVDSTVSLVAVLYSDLDGSPYELLNVGVEVTGLTALSPASSIFLNPLGLVANTQYWIGVMLSGPAQLSLAQPNLSKTIRSANTYTNGPPISLNNVETGLTDLSIFANVTASAVLEGRSYVYTYVTEYGEESPPSPATLVLGWSNAVWTLSLFTPPPDQMGVTRNIKKTRIYRTVTATGGATTYFFVSEVDVTDPIYVDQSDDDVVAANEQLASQLWTPPPENMQGILSMANGMAIGFTGNEVWFSAPYRPHAWPASYVLTTEFPIVGLGVCGTSVVICTSGVPYVATGVNPGAMSLTKLPNAEPCTSRGSILGATEGVYYASPNGLILVTTSGVAVNTTELWVTREKWQALTPQKNVRALMLVSSYFAFGTTSDGTTDVAQKGFTIELNPADAASFSIWPQPGGHRLGFQKLTSPLGYNVDNVVLDPWTGQCMLVMNDSVYYYDFTDDAPVLVPYTWRSKEYKQKYRRNFEVVRIWFDVPPGTPDLSPTRNEADFDDPSWDTLGANQYAILRVYANGNLVTAREVRYQNEILRIASGFKSTMWQFEITGRVEISGMQIGTSVKDLAEIV